MTLRTPAVAASVPPGYSALDVFDETDMPASVRALLPEAFSVVAPPQGETSEVAFIRAPGRPDIVVKHTRSPLYSQWLQREAAVLAALADSGLPIPQVLGHCEDGDSDWLLMSRIPGDNGWVTLVAASPDARRQMLQALGEVLARIHSMPVPAVLSDADSTPWLDRHRVCAEELSLEDELLSSFGPPPPELRTLIHGDFTVDNVLFEQGQLCGVIDWSGCGAGDPRFDIALALATSPELVLDARDLAAFFAGYVDEDLPGPLRTMVQDLYGVG